MDKDEENEATESKGAGGHSIAPLPGVSYPISVAYCGSCSMPFEYCEYGGKLDSCKQWLEKNLPDMFATMYDGAKKALPDTAEAASEADDGKKHQKRGGKGSKSGAAKGDVAVAKQQRVTVQRAPRGKNKFVTVIKGLTTCDVDLKAAAKMFSQKFACGSSVTGDDEIVIQGDVTDDLIDFITDKWKNIDEDNIEDLGDQKR